MVATDLKGSMDIRAGEVIFKSAPNKNEPNNSKNLTVNSSTVEGLEDVANQFEAIFLETLLRQARESKLSDSLFESKADDNFEQMFDQELANSSSKLVEIGIADAIVRQMSKTRI